MKKGHRTLYLNRTILLIMMIGYLALLILMLCMDWYLIGEYQRKNREQEKGLLHTYVENTEAAMDKVDKLIYDIYSFDDNFDNLSRVQPDVLEYGDAWELKETMNQKMLIEENLHGYYIFYGGRTKPWYNVNTERIAPEKAPVLRNLLSQLLNRDLNTPNSRESQMRSWVTVSADNEVCLAISCEKGKVALYGLHSLGKIENAVQEGAEKKLEVMILEDGIILKNKELAKQLDLLGKVQDSTEEYTARIGSYQVYGQRIRNTSLWIFMAYETNLWSVMNVQQLLLLIVTMLSVLAVWALYRFTKRQVLTPIRRLTGIMDEIRAGETKTVPDMDARFYEIRQINDTLSQMVQALEQQRVKTVEEAVEKQKAQMQYLQLQLKPHFYLNGLKTLNALVLEKETDKMQELILNLSKHIRYLLQVDRETVALKAEIAFVKNYVDLQKHVTGRRVFCEVQAPKETEDWMVPVLCIQTFVENSVKYARFGSVQVPLEILVTADVLVTEEGRFLDLNIQDNGQGYPEEILEEINKNTDKGSRSVGINNIKRRCRLLYGERAEYYFTNQDGAMSELILPEEKKNNECIISG